MGIKVPGLFDAMADVLSETDRIQRKLMLTKLLYPSRTTISSDLVICDLADRRSTNLFPLLDNSMRRLGRPFQGTPHSE